MDRVYALAKKSRIQVDVDVARKVRALASLYGLSLSELLREAIELWEKEKKKRLEG